MGDFSTGSGGGGGHDDLRGAGSGGGLDTTGGDVGVGSTAGSAAGVLSSSWLAGSMRLTRLMGSGMYAGRSGDVDVLVSVVTFLCSELPSKGFVVLVTVLVVS